MNEENQEFDQRDLNKDGKVSVKEMLQDAADAVKEGVDKVIGKVKDYNALSPEEKKAKEDEWNLKATAFAEKASDKAKEFAEEVKESAGRIFGKKDKAEEA